MSSESENQDDSFNPSNLSAEDLLLWGWVNSDKQSIDNMLEDFHFQVEREFNTMSEWEAAKKKLMNEAWFSHEYLSVISSIVNWEGFDLHEWGKANPEAFELYHKLTSE